MRKIIQKPDRILYKVSIPVNCIDSYIKDIAKDMKRYLLLHRFLGISAPQLGELVRLIGIKRNEEILFVVNPIITKLSTQTFRVQEGCCSIGNGKIPLWVTRYKIVKVAGLNLNGDHITYKGRELFGQVLQHEIDHLDGKLIGR